MDQKIKKFNIDSYVIRGSYNEYFIFNDNGTSSLDETYNRGIFITNKLDSSKKGTKWGRIVIDIQMPEDCEFYVYVMVSEDCVFNFEDQLISYDKFFNDKNIEKEKKIFVISSGKNTLQKKNLKDILLLGLEGRYLWLGFEVKSSSQNIFLNNILVYFPGDSLIKYFPEIYRKNSDDFFERYLSIFSSMNKDYQREVDNACNLIDVDKTLNRALPMLAKWLGFDIKGNFLNYDQLRILIKNAKELNQYKGTVYVINKIIELFIGDKPIIVEQIKMKEFITSENIRLYQDLYGNDPYEFLIILNRELKEDIFYQLKSLINMFKPARSKVKIIFLNQQCKTDTHCYIDINARLSGNLEGILDQNRYLDTNVILTK